MGAMRIGIASDCERALVASARSARAASRQQLRAAARQFVRRHRRDAGYLAWVLRSVGASSALAVALLGIGPQRADAQQTLFTPLPSAADPLAGHDVGIFSAPAFGDLDGDGDLDLVSGARSGRLAYFENTGSATSAAYAARTGAANPLDAEDVGSASAPALGDLDGDGDLDLVAGEEQGGFFYFENTGDAAGPAFVARTGAENPLEGEGIGAYSTPALGDVDRDGDLDLVAGAYDGAIVLFENTGGATGPAFLLRTGASDPFDGEDLGYYSAPTLGDLDRDGDLDLVAGNLFGELAVFAHTGPATLAGFAPLTGPPSPLDGVGVDDFASLALVDLDGDGHLDLVAGNAQGSFRTLENRSGVMLAMQALLGSPPPSVPFYPRFAFADLDADADLDVLVGHRFDEIGWYFENTGSATSAAFVQRTGAANPFDAILVEEPVFGDLDGDGDLDLVVARRSALTTYFENTGSATGAAFVQRTGAANPLGGMNFDRGTFGDLDADGDLDLVDGEYGGFAYLENTGSATAGAFVARTGAANPLAGQFSGFMPAPVLGDLDGDGDLDLVSTDSYYGHVYYFENTGRATSPAFLAHTGTANPLDRAPAYGYYLAFPGVGDLDGDGDLDVVVSAPGALLAYENAMLVPSTLPTFAPLLVDPLESVDAGLIARPSLGDLDADGDLDLVVGEYDGGFFYFENTGVALAPSFAARTGAANPLDGEDVGLLAAAALGDLDADGDLDLVAGESLGAFAFFENTGDAVSAAFASRTGAANPLDGQTAGPASAPALADLDGDGDLDLLSGQQQGAFRYFENTGSATSAAFVERTGAANPLAGQDVGDRSAPASMDLDRDGDLDLVAGSLAGTFFYFENSGDADTPAFALRTGFANPLDGEDVGGASAPALGDLDADGDADLVSGDILGGLRTYYLPEPGRGLLLGAGVALLGWLDRLQRRRRS
jgi:hypothetical protein